MEDKTNLNDTQNESVNGGNAGESCTVMNASSAWGTSFQISSNVRTSFLKNGAFYDIDRGADPDFVLPTPEQYYNRAALTDYINRISWISNQ